MRYTTFGHRTGLRVSEYAPGTANFGTGRSAGAEPEEARRMSDRFAEAGGTLLGSADGYQFGEAEELTGKPISAPARTRRPGERRQDPPRRLVRLPAWRVSRTVTLADLKNWAPSSTPSWPSPRRPGVAPAQVVVAWVRERAARSVATLVPIIGPRDLGRLDSRLGALDVRVTDEQYTRPAEVSAVPLGAPHEGIAASLNHLQGGVADRVAAPVVPVARRAKAAE
ncbi:hypothetical protein AB0M38_10105 [Streptomyces sp. NPDC051742]|uniref:hypothetical protein n=1 Tax=unclassified Streptomyces TaxID=2593676 RepID=UPI00342C3316